MKTKMFALLAAGLALAGCASKNCCCCKDPVIGNWGLKLGYDSMNAGHLIVERDAQGNPSAKMLWRWASPEACQNVVIAGNSLKFDFPWGFKVEATVKNGKLIGLATKKDGSVEATLAQT